MVDGIGSDGDIHDNIVIGFGPTPVVAQNGIQISRGATGEVYNNSVSANQYTGTGEASSTGVLLFGGCGDELVTNVEVHDNTVVNNDVGISMNNYNDHVRRSCDDTDQEQGLQQQSLEQRGHERQRVLRRVSGCGAGLSGGHRRRRQ